MVAPRQPLQDFLDELLAEQGRLQTPVVQASAAHDDFSNQRAQTSSYHSLIPLSAPGPGEQYAFEVDLDACSGCKACVVACHALNGLDETESWRDVGLVHGGTWKEPFQQTVTTACHHCVDPACLNGCPVLAYEKDPITGIVRHLDDQCIGCQYCVLKCPYDVPKYSERLGIVRKCDMCHQRLAVGEAPACVQACPTHAIKVVKVSLHVGATARPTADTSAFLATAPDPAYTQPTTRYVSKRPLPENLLATDAAELRPQPPHWPLVFMLTLIPASVGIYLFAALFHAGRAEPFVIYYMTNLAWLIGAAGLAASGFHLGQPLRAWRIFLGWRKSWLSREAMVFGAWFPLASASWLDPQLLLPATLIGAAGLFCSVMIYVDTRRRLWRFAQTAPRFFGNALVIGAAAALAVAPDTTNAAILALVTLGKLACDARLLHPLDHPDAHDESVPTPELSTARLLTGYFGKIFRLRIVGALFTGLVLPALLIGEQLPATAGWVIFASALLGEFAERYLFFRTVDSPKMPGTVRK
ncbi:DmsC/YnfH family molybdoenzyme membrane anchor subunit [Oleiharenicola lentus]|uniref:DmsC/YnfH family molybdoenzyme membrane anchor subunit n=1 Tax=Oleiharenicola lentus TaxID=2508720 RepID=UPI003F66AF4C